MTRPVEWASEGSPLRDSSTVGGTSVSGGGGSEPVGTVPISNGDGTATWDIITADIVVYDPTASGLAGTNVQAAIDELAASGGSGSGGMSPTELLAGEIFTVPARRQSLWSDPIIFGAGSGISLGAGSAFIEVH